MFALVRRQLASGRVKCEQHPIAANDSPMLFLSQFGVRVRKSQSVGATLRAGALANGKVFSSSFVQLRRP